MKETQSRCNGETLVGDNIAAISVVVEEPELVFGEIFLLALQRSHVGMGHFGCVYGRHTVEHGVAIRPVLCV